MRIRSTGSRRVQRISGLLLQLLKPLRVWYERWQGLRADVAARVRGWRSRFSRSEHARPASRRRLLMETIEPRILMSADLSLGSFTLDAPAIVVPGDAVSAQIQVIKQGADTLGGPFKIHLYASSDGLLDATDVLVGHAELPPSQVVAGSPSTVNINVDTKAIARPGSFQILGVVDPDNTLTESDETNNQTIAASALNLAFKIGQIAGHANVSSINLTDGDGTQFKFGITGPGTATIEAIAPTGAGLGIARQYVLTVNGATSATRIDLTQVSPGADGRIELSGINLGPAFGILNAPIARLAGTASFGTLASLTLAETAQGSTIQGSGLTGLNIAGNSQGNLALGGAGVSGFTLGTATIGGALSGTWSITGRASSVTAQSTTGDWAANISVALNQLVTKGDAAGKVYAPALQLLQVGGNLKGMFMAIGANLGTDVQLGGTGTAADSFGPGTLARVRVTGNIENSQILIGVDPKGGGWLDGDDQQLGNVTANRLQELAVGGQIQGKANPANPGSVLPAIIAPAFPATITIGGQVVNAGSVPVLTANPQVDAVAPTLSAGLQNDSGIPDDQRSNDSMIAGQAADAMGVASLKAALDPAGSSAYTDITSALQVDGRFFLTPALLASLGGGTLAEGAHTLRLLAADAAGNARTRDVVFTLDTTAPSVSAALANDTGKSATDGLTRDAGIVGSATDVAFGSLKAGLDGAATSAYVDISAMRAADGRFSLTQADLSAIVGGTLLEGAHTLHLVAVDATGNAVATDLAFVLDTSAPAGASFGIAVTDALNGSDTQTAAGIVTLTGLAEAGAIVTLASQSLSTVASQSGVFQLAGVHLATGDNSVSVSFMDAAGNTTTQNRTLTRLVVTQADAVLIWTQVALNAIRADATVPPVATRVLAIQSIAVYDTIAAIQGTPAYLVQQSVTGPVSIDAAVAAAAWRVLHQLYPGQRATFDAALAASLASITDGAAKDAGLALGRSIADAVLAIRASDGYLGFTTDDGGNAIGQWRATGPMYLVAQEPQWGDVTPFALTSSDEFRAVPPPALDSAEYAAAINQVQSLGSATGSTRTADQTQQAHFWADGGGSFTPPGHWDQIALQVATTKGNSLSANARLMAQLNIALADAAIAAWDTKYTYDFWRPVTAIQNADADGNAATIQNSNWTPLLITPPHPTYVSGHSTFSAAAAGVLAATFGDATAFSTTSSTLPGVNRNFTSFSQAADEAGMSRIYGGIHTNLDNAAGKAIGQQVAQAVLARFTLTEDTQAPSVILADTPAATRTNPTFTGQVLDNLSGVASAQFRIDTGNLLTLTLDAQGHFSLTPTLALDGSADGAHTLTLIARDAAGNLSAGTTRAFTLDTRAPTLTLTSIAEGDAITDASTLTGNGDGTGTSIVSLTYRFDNGPTKSLIFDTTTGSFDQSLILANLAAGNHSLTLATQDAAGNSATLTRSVHLDALAAFTLTEVTPTAGSSDVGVTYRPRISFSRAVNAATLDNTTFYATDTTGAKLDTTLVPAQDGSYAWMFFNSPMPGASTITLHVNGGAIRAKADGAFLDADGNVTAGGEQTWTFTTVSTAGILGTKLVGRVVDPGADLLPMTFDDIRRGPDGVIHTPDDVFLNPIVHAKVFIVGRPDLTTYTDANGNFSFDTMPVGDVKVGVDGRTATNAPAGVFWPEMVMDVTIRPGITNTVMGGMGSLETQLANADRTEIYLPRVPTEALQTVSRTQPTTITVSEKSAPDLTDEQRASLTLTVALGSAVGANGKVLTNVQIGVATVPPELVKDMLPPGLLEHSFDITIQAPGVDTFTTPVKITFPNVYNAPPGTKLNILSFDHTTGRLIINGTATVSLDGKTATSDDDSGVLAPGWHGLTPPGVGIDVGPSADAPIDRPWSEICRILNDEYEKSKGTASEVLAYQVKCLAEHACEDASADPQNTWATDWIKNVFNGIAQDSYDRQHGAPRQNAIDYLTRYPYLGTAIDYLGDLIPNFPIKDPVTGTTLFTTGELMAVWQGFGRHFVYELLPYFAQNAGNLHNTDKYGKLLHDDLFENVEKCFLDLVNMNAITPLSGLIAPPLVTTAATILREVIYYAHQGKELIVKFVDRLPLSVDFFEQSSIDNLPDNLAISTFTVTKDDLFNGDFANAGSLQVTAEPYFLNVGDSVQINLGLRDGQGGLVDETGKLGVKYYAIADKGTVSISDTGVLTVLSTATPLASIPSVIFIVAQDGSDTGVGQFAIIDKDSNGNLLSDSYEKLFFPPYRAPTSADELLNLLTLSRSTVSAHSNYYYVESLTDGSVIRGVTNDAGKVENLRLAENSEYLMRFLDPLTLKVGSVRFKTEASGVNTKIPGIVLQPELGSTDSDADGLSSIAEIILGSDPSKFSTASDHVGDGAKVSQGLNPISVVPSATGVVAALNLSGQAKAIALAGSSNDSVALTAFVGTTNGLAIADVSKAQQPIILSQLALSGAVVDVAVDSNLGIASVATGSGGLQIVDVADATTPRVVRAIDIYATNVEIIDGIVFADNGSRLNSYDLLTGEQLQTISIGGSLTGLGVEGHMLYAMDSTRTLRAIDVSSGAMVARGSVVMPQAGGRIFAGGGVVYIAAGNGFTGGFMTASAFNPDGLQVLSGVDNNAVAGTAVAVNGSGLAVAVGSSNFVFGGFNAVDVLNITDPANTGNFITRYNLPAPPNDTAIGGGVAFVADGTGGLAVVNFRSFDTKGLAPTISIAVDAKDADAVASGIQTVEGSSIVVRPLVADDVQVRNVEFLVNGRVVRNDVAFPFDFTSTLPTIAAIGGSAVTVQARATDTGGNVGVSNVLTLELIRDTVPPSLVSSSLPDRAVRGASFRTVTLDFSEPLDEATLSADSVKIFGTDGVVVPRNIQFRVGGRDLVATFDPLAIGTYSLVIDSAAVRDRAGNALGGGPVTTAFTIQEFSAEWINPDGGLWSDVANWSTSAVPGASDDVLVNLPKGATITINQTASVSRLVMTGGGEIKLTGGALASDAASSIQGSFTMSGGLLGGAGDVTVSGQLTWTGGGMSGTGKAIAAGGLVIANDFTTLWLDGGRVLENRGMAVWTGRYGAIDLNNNTAQGSGKIINAVGGEFEIRCDPDYLYMSLMSANYGDLDDGRDAVFENHGVLRKTGSNGTVAMVDLVSDGEVRVETGLLSLQRGRMLSGAVSVASGATLGLDGGNFDLSGVTAGVSRGTVRVTTGGVVTMAGALLQGGRLEFSGASLTVEGDATLETYTQAGSGAASINGDLTVGDYTLISGEFNLDGALAAHTYVQSGGRYFSSSDVLVDGELHWAGGAMAGAGRTIAEKSLFISTSIYSLELSGRVLENRGTAVWDRSYGRIELIGGKIVNATGAVFDVQCANAYIDTNGLPAFFDNRGELKFSGEYADIRATVNNFGAIDLQKGYLSIARSGEYRGTTRVSAGATLVLSGGYFALSGDVAGALVIGLDGSVTAKGNFFSAGSRVSFGGAALEIDGDIALQNYTQTSSGIATINGEVVVGEFVLGGGTVLVNGGMQAGTYDQYGDVRCTGDVTVSGQLTWGSGVMSGKGKTIAEGGLLIQRPYYGGPSLDGGRVLENRGAGVVSGYGTEIDLNGGGDAGAGRLVNAVGGVLDIQTGLNVTSSNRGAGDDGEEGTFENYGLLKQSSGMRVLSSGGLRVSARMVSDGELKVEDGTLTLAHGGVIGGTVNVLADTSLELNGGAFTLNGVDFAASIGTLRITGSASVTAKDVFAYGGMLNFSGASLTVEGDATLGAYVQNGIGVASVSGDMTVGSYALNSGVFGLDTNMTVGNYTLNGGTFGLGGSLHGTTYTQTGGAFSGVGEVTVSGQLTWTGGGMSGTGKTIAAGGLAITSDFARLGLDGGRVLENRGVAVWSGRYGTIDLNNNTAQGSGKIVNAAGGEFEMRTDPDYPSFSLVSANYGVLDDGRDAVFENHGLLRKAGSNGTVTMADLVSDGEVRVETGALSLGRGRMLSGTVSVVSGALLGLDGGEFTLQQVDSAASRGTLQITGNASVIVKGTFAYGGTLNYSGAGLTFEDAATVATLNHNSANDLSVLNGLTVVTYTQSRGTLSGTGDVTVSGQLTWTGGGISGTGKTIAAGGLTITSDFARLWLDGGRVLENRGVAVWSGRYGAIDLNNNTANGSGKIVNAAGGEFEMRTDPDYPSFSLVSANYGVLDDGRDAVFENHGLLRKAGSNGTVTMADLVSDGEVRVETGALSLGRGRMLSGAVSVASGALLGLDGGDFDLSGVTAGVTQGTVRVTTSGVVTMAGALLQGGRLEFSGASLTVEGDATLGAYVQNGTGVVSVSGNMAVGSYALNGGLFGLGGTLQATTYTQSGGTLSGTGDVTVSGLLTWTSGGMSGAGKTIAAGSMTITSDFARLWLDGGRVLENRGVAVWSGRYGAIDLNNNTANGSGKIVNAAGGEFEMRTDPDYPSFSLVSANYGALDDGRDAVFENHGVLRKAGSNGTVTMADLVSDGEVRVETGTLSLGRGRMLSGTVSVVSGALLGLDGGEFTLQQVDSAASRGTLQITGNASVIVKGTFAYGGTLNYSGAGLTFEDAATVATLNHNSANDLSVLSSLTVHQHFQTAGGLSGKGSLIIDGIGSSWSGGKMNGGGAIVILAAADFSISGGGYKSLGERSIVNSGTLIDAVQNGYGLNFDGAVSFDNRGLIDLRGDGVWADLFAPAGTLALTNTGTIKKSTGAGLFTISNVGFVNTGDVQVASGTLKIGGQTFVP